MRNGLVKKRVVDRRGRHTTVWVRPSQHHETKVHRKVSDRFDFLPKAPEKPKHRGMGEEMYETLHGFKFDNGFQPHKTMFEGTVTFSLLSRKEKAGWGGDTKYIYKITSPETTRKRVYSFMQQTDWEGNKLEKPYKVTIEYDKEVIDGSKLNDYNTNKDNWEKHLKNGWKNIYEDGSLFDSRENDPDHLYRGMSHAEMKNIIGSGEIASDQSGNFSFQEGITFFSSEPSVARSYAAGFTMWHKQATMTEPSYIIKVKKSPKMVYDESQGTGYEVGVKSGVTKNDIVEIWEVRPSWNDSDKYIEFYVSEFDGRVEGGGMMAADGRHVYKPVYRKS